MESITVDGTTLEVRRWPGDDAGPALLLLHEGLGCVELWRDVPELLREATGLEVVAYSRRGYGGSDPRPLPWPVEYMHDEAALLPDIVDALGLDRFFVIGHSDGASIAIIAAGRGDLEGLEGLVLLAPHVFAEPHGLAAIRRAGDAYRTGDLRRRLERYHREVDVAFWGWHDAWTHPDFRRWNLEAFLPDLEVPVLLVQAEEDPYGTLAQLDAIEAGVSGPVDRLVLPGDDHAPHRAHPGLVVDRIARFVGRVAS
ncbi:MAG TPA: alpha/beta hydrolase [Actinobacteria bacterium]|nr:alpha/beta hydrolase [Actinomycetota bacterium]